MNVLYHGQKVKMRSALTFAMVAINVLSVAEWLCFGAANSAGDSTGVYGTAYAVTSALLFPMQAILLLTDIGIVFWAACAAVTRSDPPVNRYALLAALPWMIVLIMLLRSGLVVT